MSQRTRAQLLEALPHLFYAPMAFALLAVAFGSPGFALFFLILGGCAHVARVGIEEWIRGAFVAEPARGGEIEVRRTRPAARPASQAARPPAARAR